MITTVSYTIKQSCSDRRINYEARVETENINIVVNTISEYFLKAVPLPRARNSFVSLAFRATLARSRRKINRIDALNLRQRTRGRVYIQGLINLDEELAARG